MVGAPKQSLLHVGNTGDRDIVATLRVYCQLCKLRDPNILMRVALLLFPLSDEELLPKSLVQDAKGALRILPEIAKRQQIERICGSTTNLSFWNEKLVSRRDCLTPENRLRREADAAAEWLLARSIGNLRDSLIQNIPTEEKDAGI